ncbi:MAG: ATP phosphoribosyltransferase regulatory subunit [Firmicutes bacterium]|nr:ATP phosphoribosyltransferase regulatory subunit [Bacillota bacterium]
MKDNLTDYNLRPDERASLELRRLYEKYGYKKYKMGQFEEYSLYASNSDFLAGNRVLTFTDLDGRLLAMKPDVTLSVMNNTNVGEHDTEKFYYIENIYRENRESHNFKEIRQMGLEYLGNVTNHGVLEVILLAAKTLDEISEDNILELNNMNYAVDLLSSLGMWEKTYFKTLTAIRQKNITSLRELAQKAELGERETDVLCQLPFLYGGMEETIERAKALAINEEMLEDVRELEVYCNALSELGYDKNLQLDFSMINDIDYYNSITFRGYVRELPGCVLAGGQYDKAMSQLDKKGGAIGFALYLDELNKGEQPVSAYDVDAVLRHDESDDLVLVAEAAKKIQSEGKTVRCVTSGEDIRCREVYVLKDGEPVKEVSSC